MITQVSSKENNFFCVPILIILGKQAWFAPCSCYSGKVTFLVSFNKVISIFDVSQYHKLSFYFCILLTVSWLPGLWEPGSPGTCGPGLPLGWETAHPPKIHSETYCPPRIHWQAEDPISATRPPGHSALISLLGHHRTCHPSVPPGSEKASSPEAPAPTSLQIHQQYCSHPTHQLQSLWWFSHLQLLTFHFYKKVWVVSCDRGTLKIIKLGCTSQREDGEMYFHSFVNDSTTTKTAEPLIYQ